jgi:acetolactate synthase I/II/III large subunit
MTAAPTAARLLVDCLAAQGCERVFTVPGESFLPVLDALHDTPMIQTVACRHEGGAAFMACADGTMTGRPGVAFVTRGPGATNASIGVHVAFQDSRPMVLFIGDVARSMRDREGFQEVDLLALFAPTVKSAARIDDPARIPEYIARAWSTAISGRPGPVVLVLPEDMLYDAVPGVEPRKQVLRPAQAPCPDALSAMMALLADAAAPLAILGGAGCNEKARHYFAAFAERIGLPVATAFRQQDAISPSSPVHAGNLGYGPNPKLVERVKAADLLLIVGTRLGEASTDSYSLIEPDHPRQTLVHVYPDPEELNRVYAADLAICADTGEFAESAALWDLGEIIPFGAGAEAHAEWKEWSTPGSDGTEPDLARCLALARETLPADSIICNGAGNFSGWWHRYWRYEGFPSQLAPTSGAMGYGVPAAVAAALRFPERQVVAVAGDGDFLMNGQELATAVQYGCDMLVIVVDNSSYGTIRMHQEREFPGRVSGTDLANPDFAALGKAYGAWSAKAKTTDEFAAALAEAQKQKGLRLIHLVTDIERLTAGGATVSGLRNRK